MKQDSPALTNFLNQAIGFYDGQLAMADAFLFALKSGGNLGYTNSENTFNGERARLRHRLGLHDFTPRHCDWRRFDAAGRALQQ